VVVTAGRRSAPELRQSRLAAGFEPATSPSKVVTDCLRPARPVELGDGHVCESGQAHCSATELPEIRAGIEPATRGSEVNRSSPARRYCYSVDAGGHGCDHRKLDPAFDRRAEGRISPLPSREITGSLRPACWKSVRRYTTPCHYISVPSTHRYGASRPLMPRSALWTVADHLAEECRTSAAGGHRHPAAPGTRPAPGGRHPAPPAPGTCRHPAPVESHQMLDESVPAHA
jgi:hypothetical protein